MGTDLSSDSVSVLSNSSPRIDGTPRLDGSKSFAFKNDGGLAELKNVLENLKAKKKKMMGSNMKRERNRVKRRIITLKERIAQLEEEQRDNDDSSMLEKTKQTEKRDPQRSPQKISN